MNDLRALRSARGCIKALTFPAILFAVTQYSSAYEPGDQFEKLFQQITSSKMENWSNYYQPLMKLVAADKIGVNWIKKEALEADDERSVDLVYLLPYFGTASAEAALEEIATKAKNLLPRISALSNIRVFASTPWNPTLAKIIVGPLKKETASACEAWMGHRWPEGVRLTCALLSNDDGNWNGPALEVRLLLADNLLRDNHIKEGLTTKPYSVEAELVLDALRAVLSNARARLAQSTESTVRKHLQDFISSLEASLKDHGEDVEEARGFGQ